MRAEKNITIKLPSNNKRNLKVLRIKKKYIKILTTTYY